VVGFRPDDLLGRTFLMSSDDGSEKLCAKIECKIIDDEDEPDNIKFLVSTGKSVDDILTYSSILDSVEKNFNDEI